MQTAPNNNMKPKGKWPHPLAIFLLVTLGTVILIVVLTRVLLELAR